MDIHKLVIGKEYGKSHAYGQPHQRVKILDVCEDTMGKWGKYWRADVEYVSDDCTKGLRIWMNTIECERYLYELNQ